ncbi:type II secretion system protein [Alicyclobacillus acidoterrestris]|uniref:Type II secretion system GspH family protein n=1 Tax=Alicyclobacillus acidoterrestris (strain ATCC 49025 / DSM 3922 / CIP 106132 / NCIMB 13137 / GD3B) TaxID=1356854 RepID=T0C921_ALIAG|nr:prepilin-type N-terminal cleavage/methylation domain-containing protein [Alicyclobacillus acidoterrestris]EPZ48980.1 hypothetical protein N007_03830 [Alicyclobacillus acidoterrestris ATCC 49025]UNO47505.1 type II secretion system GspH family protein [Alicyclobacillus acidoterrestris]
MTCRRRRRNVGGFTLLELMVAVSIVAIMIGLITPHLMGASQRASTTACQGDVKTISAALAEYDLLHQSLPSGDSSQQVKTLVSEQLLSDDALTKNFVIDDADPSHIVVTCGAPGADNAT